MGTKKQKPDYIVAGDLGYGNVKMVSGFAGEDYITQVYPATAIPDIELPRNNDMDMNNPMFDKVVTTINGEPWAVGFEMSVANRYIRPKSDDYIHTEHYKSLFASTLIKQPEDVIDTYVTGLPVEQFKDEEFVNALKELMVGKHQVAPSRTVEVKSVEVFAQPVGAFFKFVSENASDEDLEIIQEGVIAAIDPGYYTWDFTTFKKGRMRVDTSSHTQSAMSLVLHECVAMIRAEYGTSCPAANIEEALQCGKTKVVVAGRLLEFQEYLDKAAEKVGRQAVQEVRNAFSNEEDLAMIILAGGGARFYEKSVKVAYPELPVHVLDIAGIAEGYWRRGEAVYKQKQQAKNVA